MQLGDLIARPLAVVVNIRGRDVTLRPVTGAQRGDIRSAFPRPDAPMTSVGGNAVANEGNGFYQTTLDTWLARTRAAEFAIAAGVALPDGTTYESEQNKIGWLHKAAPKVLESLTDVEIVAAVGAANEQIAASVKRTEVRGN